MGIKSKFVAVIAKKRELWTLMSLGEINNKLDYQDVNFKFWFVYTLKLEGH